MIEFIENADRKEQICREILTALPDWFGIPENIVSYARECRELPLWASTDGGRADGFIAMKATSRYTAEICVMGVMPDRHRRGIGRELFGHLYEYAKQRGFEFIQVKTVREGCYADYDRTNAYYKALGFRELECFPTLWDEQNPCQIYVMAVKQPE